MVLDLSFFSEKFKAFDYSLLAAFPAETTLARLRIRRESSSSSSSR